jgi:hypothetical protein
MHDIESLREERYSVAQSIFAETFGTAREQKLMDAIAVECRRIADLEIQYAEARRAAAELLAKAEQGVSKTLAF